ncbi:MAG TPA: kelch repeat-containing protein [Gemmatimonadaceae bacterium]|jgi:DNA-binding SARP family transcriptional activator
MIHLRLLGSVDLLGHDGLPLHGALRRPKALVVLAYLAAARPRGFHRRDKIAALFWPELGADRARGALRVTLTRLRDDLGNDVILTRSADEIAIDATAVWCDVVAVDDALAAGRPLDAADLYRGPLLDGVHIEGTAAELEDWIHAERVRIRRELQRALLAEADRLERIANGSEAAIAAASRAVDVAPDDEPSVRRLIALQRAAGDSSAAVRTYDEFARRIGRDFDVRPSAETSALVSALRDSEPAVTSVDSPPSPRIVRLSPASPSPIPSASPVATPASVESLPPRRAKSRLAATVAVAVIVVASATLLLRARVHAASASVPVRHWVWLTPSEPGPRPRLGDQVVLDSTNDGFILFGGMIYSGEPRGSSIENDVWRLTGLHTGEIPEWIHMHPVGEGPSPRWLYGVAYDGRDDRLILHGGARGFTSPCSNETWVLDHASGLGATPAWERVKISGALPPERAGARASYDPATRRLILFGGNDCIATFSNDVWLLSFADSTLTSGTWQRIMPDSADGVPMRRSAYASAYDASANRLFIHGGAIAGRTLGDFWVLEHANGLGGVPAWKRVRCTGTVPALNNHAGAFDPRLGEWVLFGGGDSTSVERHEVWRIVGLRGSLSGCRWEQLQVAEPLPNARLGHSVLYDSVRGAIIATGGQYRSTGFNDIVSLKDVFRP